MVKQTNVFLRLLIGLAYLYSAGMAGWALLHGLAGDRWWWLFFLNTFALYLFLPLPLLVLLALLVRRRAAWLSTGLVLALWLYFYGGLFWPRLAVAAASDPPL